MMYTSRLFILLCVGTTLSFYQAFSFTQKQTLPTVSIQGEKIGSLKSTDPITIQVELPKGTAENTQEVIFFMGNELIFLKNTDKKNPDRFTATTVVPTYSRSKTPELSVRVKKKNGEALSYTDLAGLKSPVFKFAYIDTTPPVIQVEAPRIITTPLFGTKKLKVSYWVADNTLATKDAGFIFGTVTEYVKSNCEVTSDIRGKLCTAVLDIPKSISPSEKYFLTFQHSDLAGNIKRVNQDISEILKSNSKEDATSIQIEKMHVTQCKDGRIDLKINPIHGSGIYKAYLRGKPPLDSFFLFHCRSTECTTTLPPDFPSGDYTLEAYANNGTRFSHTFPKDQLFVSKKPIDQNCEHQVIQIKNDLKSMPKNQSPEVQRAH